MRTLEVRHMNKKLGRTLNADFWVLFVLLFLFAAVTALVGHYVLALIELAVTGLSFTVYMIYRTFRKMMG